MWVSSGEIGVQQSMDVHARLSQNSNLAAGKVLDWIWIKYILYIIHGQMWLVV